MMSWTKKIGCLFGILTVGLFLASCGGDSASSTSGDDEGIEATPDFTPTSDESLVDMAINTFTDNGLSLSVAPSYIDFDASNTEIQKDDQVEESFTVTNNTGETRTVKFEIYAVSSGFVILDEDGVNIGGWSDIEITNGESKSFTLQFNAWLFGTQTSYVTVTADIDGFIRLPMRATVTGASDFRIISTGYLCSDETAPEVDVLDFLKVASGQTEERNIKVCNTGGENIEINTARIENADSTVQSEALDGNVFEEFIWSVDDDINTAFSFGLFPETTRSFAEPTFVDYNGSLDNPAGSFAVVVNQTGGSVDEILLEAGKLLTLDVSFAPELDVEAPEGQRYNPIAMNAKLILDTSLGEIAIPLLGATGGIEPILKMQYRLSDSEIWRDVDLKSDGAAFYFGAVDVFLDWVTDNYRGTEVRIENAGTGAQALEFYGTSLSGYFEYYEDEGDDELSFPITLNASETQVLKMRYLPTPDTVDETEHWDFGQFYFQHNGGNGPQGKIVLVGEETAGYAVQLKLGGAELERSYDENQFKNLCVFQADDGASAATPKTFTVYNNSQTETLQAEWGVSVDQGSFSYSSEDATLFEVEPNSSKDFTIDFLAASEGVGESLEGTLTVNTSYPEKESEYASYLTDKESRNFTVPFQAQGSESGTSSLCTGEILGTVDATTGRDTTQVTYIIDRIGMGLTSLIEVARNRPAFKYFLPLEIDVERGTARLAEDINFSYTQNAGNTSPVHLLRIYNHQGTNIRGCAPLPTNPYKVEFEKGSWTGPGFDCGEEGTVNFTDVDGTTQTLNTDTACFDSNGGEETYDADNVKWAVYYQDFIKLDTSSCDVEYYGKIATFAYRPDQEGISDVFAQVEAEPNEDEAYYESIFHAYQFDSYIMPYQDLDCNGTTYPAGTAITDPDALKGCYKTLAANTTSTRKNGFINECAHFNFNVDAGIEPDDVDSENPDYDSWQGFGTYEPYVDDDGKRYDTKYDITIYNGHMQTFVLNAGDRSVFFGHPSHLLYADIYITLTTKRVAEEDWQSGDDWQQRIAVNARPHFTKDLVFLEDGKPYSLAQFWTGDGFTSELSNVIDDANLDRGEDFGGYGKGAFRYMAGSKDKIIFSGWPVNYDENNLMVWVGLSDFAGGANTAPSFAKADVTTGLGKPLYFMFHGCLVAGDPEENAGCFDYKLDNALMTENDDASDDDVSVLSEYVDYGMLPYGYMGDDSTDTGGCSQLSDPGFVGSDDFDVYQYMPCINFKIFTNDRDRATNYYNPSNRFTYSYDYYSDGSTCGYGM